MKGTTQHKKRVTNSHNRGFISLGGFFPFFIWGDNDLAKWKSHHVMWADGGWWMCVENDDSSLNVQIWFMPDGQTNGKRKEVPFSPLGVVKSFVSSFQRYHHDDYLFMFPQNSLSLFLPSHQPNVSPFMVEKHISQHWLFIVFQPAGVWVRCV